MLRTNALARRPPVLATLVLSLAGVNAASGERPIRWTPAAISTADYESSPAFTPDGRTMFYVAADAGFRRYRLMQSRCERGRWTRGRPPSFAAGAEVIEADPFVTPDGRRLYFVSARHDPKNEDFDVYRVERLADGTWGIPVRLPAPVNSPASELMPREDGAGNLYFGSARPGGFGRSDIYVAAASPSGAWTVRNLGAPVSTAANEYEAEVSRDGRILVVVADRGDRSHLYRFERNGATWREVGRVPAATDVFQVGPLLSPRAERLLFAQAVDGLSGEMFLVDLRPGTDEAWPPRCP